MIRVSGLTRYFQDFCAVDNLSFDVREGEIVGFLGPNGAGKSTTMKMLTGFLAPSRGTVEINQFNIEREPVSIKQDIGYLPEGAPSYSDMRVYDFLKFIGHVRGFSGERLITRMSEVVEKVELQEVIFKSIETLSKGFKRRVGIAQAIFHDPKILILDEPTDGLDPNQKHQVRQLIKNMSKDKIIIISTHILEEVSAVCNRAMIIARGKKLFDGTPDELIAQSEYHNSIHLVLESATEDFDLNQFESLEGIEKVQQLQPDEWLLQGDGSKVLAEVVSTLDQHQIKPKQLELRSGQLDQVFRTITRGA